MPSYLRKLVEDGEKVAIEDVDKRKSVYLLWQVAEEMYSAMNNVIQDLETDKKPNQVKVSKIKEALEIADGTHIARDPGI